MIKKPVNNIHKERKENGISCWHETQKRMGFYQRLEALTAALASQMVCRGPARVQFWRIALSQCSEP